MVSPAYLGLKIFNFLLFSRSCDFMQPHGSRQRELSANALIELLWKVVKTKSFPSNSLSFFNQLGEKKYAVFAIQGPTHNFEIPETFEKDGVTEKV